MDVSTIRRQAEEELKQERFREAVESEKERLRKKTAWDKIFPWRILIVKKD